MRNTNMKKIILATLLLLPVAAFASGDELIKSITPEDIKYVQSSETYTYVRCWYRPHYNHDDPATDWKWALNENGSYYTISGYWYSSTSFMNMFYTTSPQKQIMERCAETLDVTHDTADITYFAADNKYSYNHSIWVNDSNAQPDAINKIVSFGDSISDTGNFFNGAQWQAPNINSWFLGHFTNGFVWTEYLAKEKALPLYTWAVGGAAGNTQKKVLSGIHDQIDSYLNYVAMAKNYQPENSLFTLEFGLNDFVNYDRSVIDVSNDFSYALKVLTDNGAQNILILNLPDATKSPQFKYSTEEHAKIVKQKITSFNLFIKKLINEYQNKGVNIVLFDTNTLIKNIINTPEKYGFSNAKDACLNINRSSTVDYFTSHALTSECNSDGSDNYVFWGVTHPTTKTHKVIAEQISGSKLKQFKF